MSVETSTTIFAVFLIFCRIGSCLMVLPGYSSAQIPTQVRLFIAVGVSMAMSPSLLPDITRLVANASDDMRIAMIVREILSGLLIGLLGRVFMLALQFAGSLVANAIGMGQSFGVTMEENDPVPALVTLITLTATVLIFALNLHAEVLNALFASYRAVPVQNEFSIRTSLTSLVDDLDDTFMLCLRIASPFVVYTVVVNFAIGLANKMTPQIPIYFISLPFVLAGGLLLLSLSIGDFLTVFMAGFRQWVMFG